MEIWNILNSKYRTVICAGSRNDSGMGMSFTWHGSGMERVWNGVWNEMDPSLQKKTACLFFWRPGLSEYWYGMVWYGMVWWIRTTELTVVEHQTLTRPSAKPNWKGIGGPTGHAASDMAQVFHWPPVRRQILGRYAEAKQIGPQPQNTWGNTNSGIPQITIQKQNQCPQHLQLLRYGSWVWIVGMDHIL